MSPEPPDPAAGVTGGTVGGAAGRFADSAVFAAQFARSPVTTASVWPSSGALARAMAEAARPEAPECGARVVVELGPGSGTVTGALTARAGLRDRHLAVEINPVLAHRLADRFPRVEVVPADVAELPTLLALRGLPQVDVVVSGLGWSATRPGADDALVPVLSRVLADDGVLVQFAYRWTRWATPARTLRAELDAAFETVDVSPVVWRNLPPAVVYRAHRPRRPVRSAVDES